MTIEKETTVGQTIAEADTLAPPGVGGWHKQHNGVWVTSIPADDGRIAAFVAWGVPDRDQAMAAFEAYAATDGLNLAEELAAVGYAWRETWACRVPVVGEDAHVYAEIAGQLQLDACPLDGTSFEVLVLEPGPAVTQTTETPEERQ